ncbi:MAG: hypothetical protein NT020_02965 [Chloroflexales bacterium]|nr:hypothetical protein [Chloroflexales bacterium]
MYRIRALQFIVLVAVLMGGILPIKRIYAATDCITSNEICIDSSLATFWQHQGGVAIFGLPLAPSTASDIDGVTIITQQFERARLEYHATNPAPYTILLGRIGAESINDVDIQTLVAVDPPHSTTAANKCKQFDSTPFQACGDFLAFWSNHGIQQDANTSFRDSESIALFGIPLSPPYLQLLNGETYVVQVFERARMEYHPNNPVAYRIQLGLLGSEKVVQIVQPAPITPTVTILDHHTLEFFRSHMPYTGYWEHSSDGIYVAVGGFKYLTEFFGAPAPDGHRYVALSVTIANTRAPHEATVYIDRTYFKLTDIDGNPPVSALSNSTDLKTEFLAQTIAPGGRIGGQLIFLIANKYGVPAQLTVTVTNMDPYLSQNSQTVELRVWPLGAVLVPIRK